MFRQCACWGGVRPGLQPLATAEVLGRSLERINWVAARSIRNGRSQIPRLP